MWLASSTASAHFRSPYHHPVMQSRMPARPPTRQSAIQLHRSKQAGKHAASTSQPTPPNSQGNSESANRFCGSLSHTDCMSTLMPQARSKGHTWHGSSRCCRCRWCCGDGSSRRLAGAAAGRAPSRPGALCCHESCWSTAVALLQAAIAARGALWARLWVGMGASRSRGPVGFAIAYTIVNWTQLRSTRPQVNKNKPPSWHAWPPCCARQAQTHWPQALLRTGRCACFTSPPLDRPQPA